MLINTPELPNPKVDLPKAVFAQISLGLITALCYAIAILYGISDLDAVINSSGSFPLAEVYRQATGSEGATFGLLFIVFLNMIVCNITTITVSHKNLHRDCILLTLQRWSAARSGC
jgi:amino acid transporter